MVHSVATQKSEVLLLKGKFFSIEAIHQNVLLCFNISVIAQQGVKANTTL